MSLRRTLHVSAVVLGFIGSGLAIAGCGGGGSSETGPTGEVKIVPPANPAPNASTTPVTEEYKNMDPAGVVKKR